MSSSPDSTGTVTEPAPLLVPDTVVDRELRNPFYRYLMHLGLPITLSIVIHVVALILAGFYGFAVITRDAIEVGDYNASLTESLADRMKDAFQWNNLNLLETPDESEEEASFEQLMNPLDVPDLTLSDLRDPGTGAGEGSGLGIGDGTLSLLGTGSGATEAGRGGFGQGLGGGGARIGTAGIWDLTIRANTIAYVVDFSGSILVAVDDLKRELKKSIGRLKSTQSFNVIIFYSSGGGRDERVKTETFKTKLEPAIEVTRREFFTWIDRKAPRGRTEPLGAMKRALSLSPEAVFFFSDGYFDDTVVGEINRANRRARAKIFCLVFDDQLLGDTSGLAPRETDGSRRLRRIAEANRGQVKIVTGKDLRRR